MPCVRSCSNGIWASSSMAGPPTLQPCRQTWSQTAPSAVHALARHASPIPRCRIRVLVDMLLRAAVPLAVLLSSHVIIVDRARRS